MADPNRPVHHGYADMLGTNPTQKNLNYDELVRRAKQRQTDLERTKAWIQEEASIKEYAKIPSEELATIAHYSNMPDVEIDSGVSEYFKTQQEELAKIDFASPQQEYLSAYQEWQRYLESLDDRRRDELGVNNIDQREEQAQRSVSQAQQRLKDARRRVKDMQDDVDPFKAMIGAITGANKDSRTVRDAYRGVKEAKRGLKDARRNLQAVRESRAALEEKKASLSAKEYMVLKRMSDAQYKMAFTRETARQIVEGGKGGAQKSEDVRKRLHDQYQLIDKYKAIQALKTGNQYVAISNHLKATDPALLQKLESIPTNLPAQTFKVTLDGPLQIPSQADKIADVDKKIADVQSKLPAGINMNDLTAEILALKLKDTDNVAGLEAQMSSLDPTSKEYKQLEMKKDHLTLQAQVDAKKAEIMTLKNELATLDPSDQKAFRAKYQTLQNAKVNLELLQEKLSKDPYSRTLSGLEELQKLTEERKPLEGIDQLATNIEPVAQDLGAIQERASGDTMTISNRFFTELHTILISKAEHIKMLGKQRDIAPVKAEQDFLR